MIKVGKKEGTENFINQGTYPFRVAVIDDFVRFACGILWKYAATAPDDASHIEIGECKELFEAICFHGAAVPEGVDVFIERDRSPSRRSQTLPKSIIIAVRQLDREGSDFAPFGLVQRWRLHDLRENERTRHFRLCAEEVLDAGKKVLFLQRGDAVNSRQQQHT